MAQWSRSYELERAAYTIYWYIAVNERSVAVSYGRSDYAPNVQNSMFNTPEEAERHALIRCTEREKNGFIAKSFKPLQPREEQAVAKTKPLKYRLICTTNRSNKFWEVEAVNRTLITRWGRIGTAGQAQTEELTSASAAVTAAITRRRAKLKRGYVDDSITTDFIKPAVSPVRIVPRAEERRFNDPIAKEALDLFQKISGKSASSKPKKKPKASKSALVDSSKNTPSAQDSSRMRMDLRPKRRVII